MPHATITSEVPGQLEKSAPVPSSTEPIPNTASAPTYSSRGRANGFEYQDTFSGTCKIIGYTGEEAEDLSIPEKLNGFTVTAIGDSAFDECYSLSGNLTIPDGVIEIGRYGFYSCQNLTNITIPSSVAKIGKDAFHWCTGLTSIEVSEQNASYSSLDGVLFDKAKSKIIAFPEGSIQENYSIPDSVTTIEDNAFYWCHGLTSVTMPNSITAIGDSAFAYCISLTGSLIIPESVTTIGNEAFSFCSDIDEAAFLGNAPVTFGKLVFASCKFSFKITFDPSKSGWSVPTWNGYTVFPRESCPQGSHI